MNMFVIHSQSYSLTISQHNRFLVALYSVACIRKIEGCKKCPNSLTFINKHSKIKHESQFLGGKKSICSPLMLQYQGTVNVKVYC